MQKLLYIGDTESDVITADRAGFGSAFVRRLHCQDITRELTPIYEFEDLRDVVQLVRG